MTRIISLACVLIAAWIIPDHASAECMTYTPTQGRPIKIVAASADVKTFEARGYKRSTCTANFTSKASDVDYMCSELRAYPPKAIARFTQTYKATPEQICKTAEAYHAETRGE